MTDKEIIDEFARLYNDFGSIDEALYQIHKIISPKKYYKLVDGLARLMK